MTDSYLPSKAVTAAFGRLADHASYVLKPQVMSCSMPSNDSEDAVICLRQGCASWIVGSVEAPAVTTATADALRRAEQQHGPDVIAVEFPNGSGVLFAGKLDGRPWLPVDLNGRGVSTEPRNRRDEAWAALRSWLDAGGAIPVDERLRDELLAVRADDLAAAGSRARALALTFALPVPARREPKRLRQHRNKSRYYDPFR